LYVFVRDASVWSRIPALFFHATNTSIVAYGIGKNKALKYFFLAAGLHFVNNFSASFGDSWYFFGIAATFASYVIALHCMRRATNTIVEYWMR
jgi:hypothetical protein